MNSAPPLTRQHILDLLENVKDPEVPVISVRELGVLRDVEMSDGKVLVTITPTYTGCPAMDTMREDIVKELHNAGIRDVEVKQILSPAWTTDWISDAGKAKLKAYGIAPPEKTADIRALKGEQPVVPCPQCGSKDTVMVSAFGSTACKALWKCKTCLEPFDQFKCL
ncbi:MAG: phenylacetate-CoA oxygenase subunit PaaJ [Flavobacteriales bacterium]|nr:phenylacetate-CoA oxygenase subunit PaaJ [Flavobacteriales bacterium]